MELHWRSIKKEIDEQPFPQGQLFLNLCILVHLTMLYLGIGLFPIDKITVYLISVNFRNIDKAWEMQVSFDFNFSFLPHHEPQADLKF